MSDRPTPAQLQASYGLVVPDLVAPDLDVLLCGINPSLWSGWARIHFARPSNRLWPTLHQSGLTPERLLPTEPSRLLDAGIGVTNLVARATARADELTDDEIRAGRAGLEQLAETWHPKVVAVLGVTAYRLAFGARKATVGKQLLGIGPSRAWVLPNPSGLNAHYQQPDLTRLYRELKEAL